MKTQHGTLFSRRFSTPVLIGVLLMLLAVLGACTGVAPADTLPAAEEAAAPEATAVPEEEAAAADDTPAEAFVGDGELSALDPGARNGYYTEPPAMTIDPTVYYYATIVTDKGDIKLQLFADRAPKTVNNFVFLANQGFYDNTTFHRVLDGFMAQAGDPTGTGAGGPGYQFEDEFAPGLGFDRPGLLAMANSGPGTNGSQFFITFAPTDWLNNRHTIFGEVVEGSEVLSSITLRDPSMDTNVPGDLIQTIVIEEGSESLVPTPTPLPPTPTPFPPTNMEQADDRPLAAVPMEERSNYFNTAPEMVIDADKSYSALITTSQGDMTLELFADVAPIAVNNFVVLSNLGFYDGMLINQVMPEQVVIVGSPLNSPDSDAGYGFEAELDLPTVPATGSVAYIPFQNSTLASSSQLLFALVDPPATANISYSFFGKITDGLDVLAALTGEDTIDAIVIEESE